MCFILLGMLLSHMTKLALCHKFSGDLFSYYTASLDMTNENTLASRNNLEIEI